MKNNKLQIFVIRHGRTALNAQKVFRGHLDVPLDAVGMSQAEATGQLLKDIDLSVIYTSPLKRSIQTANSIKKYQDKHVKVVPDQGFTDLSYGQWEGKTHEEVKEQYPDLFELWEKDPGKAVIPDAETLSAARERIWAAFERIISENSKPAIAIVSHRVVNKLLLTSMLGLNESDFWKIQQDTCCLNVIEYRKSEFTVLKLNHNSHIISLQESMNIVDF